MLRQAPVAAAALAMIQAVVTATRRSLATFIPLGLFLAVALVLGVGLLRGHARDLPPDRVRPLPSFALAPLRPGQPGLASADLQGKVALINVFASWCTSCAVEAPTLQRIAASGAAPLYGVAWLDAPEKSQEWLAKYGDPFARIGEDTSGRLGLDLGVTGAPETFVVDKQGRIRLRYPAPIDDAAWAATFQPLLAKLNAEPG